MAKKTKNYSIGLDIGTNSVGWAVIDEEYRLAKIKNKDAWGAFLFDNAETAKKTRMKRSQRRRYERRKERIRLLQELMSDCVLKQDAEFFNKLKESSYSVGEGSYFRKNAYNLFNGDYTDRDFYHDENSRTIYHLRNYLATTEDKADIRKIYLAIHHIVKYRGNFLYEGKKLDFGAGMLVPELNNLFEILLNDFDCDMRYVGKTESLADILRNKNMPKAEKKRAVTALFSDVENSDFIKEFASAVLGYKAKLTALILSDSPVLGEDGKEITFAFSDSKYDENEDMYLSIAGDKESLFTAVKAIYTAILFEDVMQGEKSISLAMIKKYDKHKTDLKILKKLFKTYIPKSYSKFFRREKGANYVNYIGTNTKYVRYNEKVGQDKFYAELKKLLENVPECEEKRYCLDEIEKKTFLPKLNDVSNSAIPYQMNEKELQDILDNQGRFYPELVENREKIMSLLTFRRPYYVGTLKGKYSWAKQIIDEKITPWNFYDVVDTDALAEDFIVRMTNKCRLCPDQDALPKNSIIYQAYCTLNEINKMKFKEKAVSVDWKKFIFLNLCCKKKTVKIKDIAAALRTQYNVDVQDGDIQGFAEDKLTSSMSALIDFKNKLKEDFKVENINQYEEAVRILTIFDDIKIRRKKISAIGVFTSAQVESLIKLKYTKWGSYSRYVIHGLYGKNGKTVLETMYDTNKHFNEIIFDKELGFCDSFSKEDEKIDAFRYNDVDELYCSPAVKKGIWNALKIVEEIEKTAKNAPSRIFIESTASEEEKKKTDSRLKKLSELYKTVEGDKYFSEDCYNEIKERNKENRKIDSDKLYLWLIQLGRCMYSGETISFDQIGECEIDHIVPRSYIVDDSFENRVLVKKIENQRKSDTLALNFDVQKSMREFWKFLYDKKFIGSKKYANLTKAEYTERDSVGFINRQLVETSQIVKEVKKLLQRRYPEAVIQCVKAGMNKQFRNKYAKQNKAGFYKLRNMNNFHHAKDAYLTAVVGQFTTVACPLWGQEESNRYLKYYIRNASEAKDDVRTLVNKRYGIILDLMEYGDMDKFAMDEEGEYLWNSTRYSNIFDTMQKNNCIIVKKKKIMAESAFYDETLYSPKSDKKGLMPIKNKNGEPMPTEIYGGYSSVKPAYFAIISYIKGSGKKAKTQYVFDNIPVYIVWKEKTDKVAVENYIKDLYGDSAKILKIIHKYQLVLNEGQLCYVTGTRELNNATELYVNAKFERMLYHIEQGNKRALEENREKYVEEIKEFISHYNFIVRSKMPLYAKFADKLEEIVEKYYDNMTYEEKIQLVKDMLTVSNTGAGRIEMDKKFGGGGYGRLIKSVDIKNAVFIDNSCTGLYCKMGRLSDWAGEVL